MSEQHIQAPWRTPFFDTIQHLRTHEEVVLYGRLLQATEGEDTDVIHFLEAEFDNEALDFPYSAPAFDPAAAAWGATIFYRGAQLLLHREQAEADLDALFPAHPSAPTPSAILSADLCLRFLPTLISALHRISMDDALIPILEQHLCVWHYSGIGHQLRSDESLNLLHFSPILANPCVLQCYVDRVIRMRDGARAVLPEIELHVKSSLGGLQDALWPDGPFLK